MLDLVKPETARIESRFLEPACGTGNFLAEILRRKLTAVTQRYAKSREEWQRYALLAVTSLYGIDILADNVARCRQRLFDLFEEFHRAAFRENCEPRLAAAALFVLGKNIIWGDALTLRRVDSTDEFIVFCEWSLIGETQIKRRDFKFENLVQSAVHDADELFRFAADNGSEVFLPKPLREYPPTHYLEVAHES